MWFDDEDRDLVLGKIMWAGVVLFLLFGLIAYMDAEELILPGQVPPSLFVVQDEGDDPHANQPDHCSNAREAKPPNKCECKKTPVDLEGNGCEVEDVKCKVYCRKNKCFCFHPDCDS